MSVPNLHTFRTIQGCPVFADICPYIAICVNDAHAHVNSIYRGDDAKAILHKHGKESQSEAYWNFIHGRGAPANRPGQSTHELRSDGVAYRQYRLGVSLPWWCQGFDVNDVDVPHVITQARQHGWDLFQPYQASSEYHHLNFRIQPRRPNLGSPLWLRMQRIRLTYPRG